MTPLVITTGEPAGIGPELCLQIADQTWSRPMVVLGDRSLLQARAQNLGLRLSFKDYTGQPLYPAPAGILNVLHLPLKTSSQPGILNPENGAYVLSLLDRALSGCQSGEFAGMVTAPVHKGVINQAGFPFTGHTEYLAEKTSTPLVVMMLAGRTPHGPLRVALATTHLPLRAVADAITPPLLQAVIRILHTDLKTKFGLPNPRILVAGLNPHAGEDGYLGREEIDVMIPALDELRSEGLTLLGPLPADTLFNPPSLAQGDAVLAMYHDQGLTALKYATFGHGINITLGLPVLRTSVDHGTALTLAGTGKASSSSLEEAIRQALFMADHQAPFSATP